MKITKLEHSCLDINSGDGRLIIDPGQWTKPLEDYTGITAVVVTHVHPDHLDASKILKISEQNPSLVVFCTQQVADKLGDAFRITVPNLETEYTAGVFKLEFFGGMHALISPDRPQDQNFGVLVNDTLYYPGDSLVACPKPHPVLATPAAAPWMKISEAMEFLKTDTAKEVFPMHNAILSEVGTELYNSMLGAVADSQGKTYHPLKPGESLEV